MLPTFLEYLTEAKHEYHVYRKGGSIGNGAPALISKHEDRDEAIKAAKRHRGHLSKGEKQYYGIKYHIKKISK